MKNKDKSVSGTLKRTRNLIEILVLKIDVFLNNLLYRSKVNTRAFLRVSFAHVLIVRTCVIAYRFVWNCDRVCLSIYVKTCARA
jgi:hypothetical protein